MQAVPGQTEAELPNGLIAGHAYSITDVRMVRATEYVLFYLKTTLSNVWRVKVT
jgi:hypothetical protein